MATSLPADAPKAPQNRKQIADAAGNFTPVPDVPQYQHPTEPDTTAPEFKVGDAVTLLGRVIEVVSPQGGQVNVKVQLANNAGAVWLRSSHILAAEPPVGIGPVIETAELLPEFKS